MSSKGVVYLFSGVAYAERMAVALHSLRQHWTGPVTMFATDQDCFDVGGAICKSTGCDIQRVTPTLRQRHTSYLWKTMVPTWTPYEESIFIDGDTVVVGSLDELFGHPWTVTHFSDWQTFGRVITGRINKWRGLTPAIDELIEVQLRGMTVTKREAKKIKKRGLQVLRDGDEYLAGFPALNTGVFAFQKGYHGLAWWNQVTIAGAGRHWTDEIAAQLIYSHLPECRLLDDRFNCSPIYGIHKEDVRVWHTHGSKHMRRAQGKKVWIPAYWDAYNANVGGIQKWAGDHDKRVNPLMVK